MTPPQRSISLRKKPVNSAGVVPRIVPPSASCFSRVERGIVKVGDEVEIVGIRDTAKSIVTGVEMFRKLLDQGQPGDNVGVLLRGTKKDDVERGQVLAKPGSRLLCAQEKPGLSLIVSV